MLPFRRLTGNTELKTQGCPREVSTAPSQQDAQDDSNVATQRTLTPTIHLPPAHSLIRPVLPAYRDIVIGQPSQCMTQRKSEFDTVSTFDTGSHHPLGRSRLLSLTHRACYRLGPLHRRTWHAWCVLCVAENRPATTD
ncbi:hypothetical protein ACJJTC_002042 [Scirpophaga incertulas]